MNSLPVSGGPRRRLLFVDDEPRVLEGLKQSLRPYRQHWDVETATSGVAALALLDQRPFDSLVTDARMPDMDGAQLLVAARERWPDMLRVVLSGETAKDGHTRLTQLAHHFIPKPVTMPVLYARIEEALAGRQQLGSRALQAVVCRMGTLPVLSGTFTEVNRLVDRVDATLAQLVHALEHDPAMCANVLRVVNSAWFGSSSRVGSMTEAVKRLGFRPLRDLVLAAEVFGGGGVEIENLRDAALQRLAALPALLQVLQAPDLKETAAAAVILADVGRLLIVLRAKTESAAIEHEVKAGHERIEVELSLLGSDHAQLGGALLQLWSFPSELSEAVALHHTALDTRALSTLVALVCALQDLDEAPEFRKEALSARVLTLAVPFGVQELAPLTCAFRPTKDSR